MDEKDDVTTSRSVTYDNEEDTSGSVNPTSYHDNEDLQYPTWAACLILIACTVIMLGTILGNLLVCTAVSIVRKLRTPSNWLIVSLAVADLLVALLVMPLASAYEVLGKWIFGQMLCDMWTSLDVMLCTASILNLCMISIDRYFVITKPFEYAVKRTPARMALMIMSVWLLSALISIPPLFGSWKAEFKKGQCELSQHIGYQFYATIGAFYLPLAVMILIYYRIYIVSSRISRAESKSKPVDRDPNNRSSSLAGRRKISAESGGVNDSSLVGTGGGGVPAVGSRISFTVDKNVQYGRSGIASRENSEDANSLSSKVPLTMRKKSFLQRSGFSRMSSNAAKSETKATKTLGVIMGAFTACWLPFFILALIKALLGDESIPSWLSSILLWLGYTNSFLNPIIYARFNREFRTPFKEILLGRCRGINVRMRSESYTEQYGDGVSGHRPSMRRPSSGVSHLGGAQADLEVCPKPSLIEEDDVFLKESPVLGPSNGVKPVTGDLPNNNSIL